MKGLSIVWSKSICISRCIIKKSVKFTHSSPKSPTSVKLLMVNLQSSYINRVNIHSYCSSFVYHYFNYLILFRINFFLNDIYLYSNKSFPFDYLFINHVQNVDPFLTLTHLN